MVFYQNINVFPLINLSLRYGLFKVLHKHKFSIVNLRINHL